MTDLSKTFDCLYQDLLIAKLHAYWSDNNALKLVYSYIIERKKRVKMNQYSERGEIRFVAPQGSILSPLSFNIFCDLVFNLKSIDTASLIHCTTFYTCCKEIDLILEKLETATN